MKSRHCFGALILIVFSVLVASAVVGDGALDGDCSIEVVNNEKVVVEAFQQGACSGEILQHPGFVIVARLVEDGDRIADRVIWSWSSIDVNSTEYAICDLDHDNNNEFLALFFYDVSVYGYVLQFSFDDQDGWVKTRETPIPESLLDELGLYDSVGVANDDFMLYGWSGLTDEHTRLRIGVDEQTDQVSFEIMGDTTE